MSRSKFSVETILQQSRATANNIVANQQTKEASAAPTDSEFGAILDSLTSEKVASPSATANKDEVIQLLQTKVAELAAVNESAMIKEAQILGAAVFDGMLTRASEAEHHATKLAQVLELENPDLEKIAEDIGYNQGIELGMKIAAFEVEEGQKIAYLQQEAIKVACYEKAHIDTLAWLGTFAP